MSSQVIPDWTRCWLMSSGRSWFGPYPRWSQWFSPGLLTTTTSLASKTDAILQRSWDLAKMRVCGGFQNMPTPLMSSPLMSSPMLHMALKITAYGVQQSIYYQTYQSLVLFKKWAKLILGLAIHYGISLFVFVHFADMNLDVLRMTVYTAELQQYFFIVWLS